MAKIGFIHLTDLHITQDTVLKPAEKVVSAIKADWLDVKHLYLILSGDIAFSGCKEQYEIAEKWISSILLEIQEKIKIQTTVYLSPGNHDCDFTKSTNIRSIILKDLLENGYKNLDRSYIDNCVSIQADYWDFYRRINSKSREIEKSIFYEVEETTDCNLSFCEINTAMTSVLNESETRLFVPVKNFPRFSSDGTIRVAVFHHPLSWLTSQNEDNNKNEFRTYLQNNFDFAFCGHEHNFNAREETNISTRKGFVDICGASFNFQEKDKVCSEFQTIVFDTETKELKIKTYYFKDDMFCEKNKDSLNIDRLDSGITGKYHKKDFVNDIEKIDFTLPNKEGKQAVLRDIFIYPNLEKSSSSDEKNDYPSGKILDDDSEILVIDGDAQSGKTSLAIKLFLDTEKKSILSLFLKNKDIRVRKNKAEEDIEKIIKTSFEKQYEVACKSFEEFKQQENKILFIDDFSIESLGKENFRVFFEYLKNVFKKIFIFTTSSLNWQIKLKGLFDGRVSFFKILPFNNKQRSELCEKYFTFYENRDFDKEENDDLDLLKNCCVMLRQIMHNRIIPSYPIYILTLLQAQKNFPARNFEKTSYSECYRMLINLALMKGGYIKDDEVNMRVRFLEELSFWIYKRKDLRFTKEEYDSFSQEYAQKYIVESPNAFLSTFLNVNILKKDDELYSFSYRYIYYYLVAGKIAKNIDKKEGKEIVEELCSNLNSLENANILIFIANYTESENLLDEVSFATMLPFENYKPATLDVKSEYFNFINEVVEKISSSVIQGDVDPYETHKEIQEDLDDVENKDTQDNEGNVDSSDVLAPILQSFRSTEILGQIIKNRYASIKKEKLQEMMQNVFECGFRTLDFFCQELIRAKDDLVLALTKELEKKKNKKDDPQKIKQTANNIVRMFSYFICHMMIYKVSNAVAQKNITSVADETASRINSKENSPVAKLTAFSIALSSGKFNMKKLEELHDEFYKKNVLAHKLLCDIVRNYIYTNNIERSKKQRIADVLKLEVRFKPTLPRNEI